MLIAYLILTRFFWSKKDFHKSTNKLARFIFRNDPILKLKRLKLMLGWRPRVPWLVLVLFLFSSFNLSIPPTGTTLLKMMIAKTKTINTLSYSMNKTERIK